MNFKSATFDFNRRSLIPYNILIINQIYIIIITTECRRLILYARRYCTTNIWIPTSKICFMRATFRYFNNSSNSSSVTLFL